MYNLSFTEVSRLPIGTCLRKKNPLIKRWQSWNMDLKTKSWEVLNNHFSWTQFVKEKPCMKDTIPRAQAQSVTLSCTIKLYNSMPHGGSELS